MVALNQAALYFLAAGHLVAVGVTVARYMYLRGRSIAWFHDSLALATAILDIILAVLMVIFAVEGDVTAVLYKVDIIVYFVVIWSSRACLILASTHSYRDLQPMVHRAWVLYGLLIAMGISYGFLAAFFCTEDVNCAPSAPCVCYPPTVLLVFTFSSELIFDVAIVIRTWNMLVFEEELSFRDMHTRSRLELLGLSSNILIVVSSSVCLGIYLSSQNIAVLLYVVNANAIVAVFVVNVSALVELVTGRFYSDTSDGAIELQNPATTVTLEDASDTNLDLRKRVM